MTNFVRIATCSDQIYTFPKGSWLRAIWGYRGIMEKKMVANIGLYRGYPQEKAAMQHVNLIGIHEIRAHPPVAPRRLLAQTLDTKPLHP